MRQAGVRSGSTLFNLAVLAAAIPAVLTAWTAIGEWVGDVYQADGDGLFVHVLSFVLSTLYLSLLLYALFIPGFALFLLLARRIGRSARLSEFGARAVAVALSPVIALVFYVIPAVPEDRDAVFSGWWFIVGTCLVVALLARTPLRSGTPFAHWERRVTP